MKKIIKLVSAITLCSLVLTVAPAFAQTNVTTNLNRDTTGGANPIVKAKWEANGTIGTGVNMVVATSTQFYMDDAVDAGAQFLPSGQYQVNKKIAFCAVVTDPDGLADIDNVYFDFFYPAVALGSSHVALTDQSGLGCSELMQEDSLTRLSKAEGLHLFCNQVRNLNNNLPTFNSPYDYNEICNPDGELQKETAAVYCGTKDISYEDPAEDYEVWAVAQDKNGLQGTLKNEFTYLPVTAFETDFTSVAYGNVRLNTHKIISGDLLWGGPRASVRNVGNTRLSMQVWQDDMGFDKTDGIWNVEYDARVGSGAAFSVYAPETTNTLDDSLDLSELDEMDFSIDVSKFPPTHTSDSYTGTIVLSAVPENHLSCVDGEEL